MYIFCIILVATFSSSAVIPMKLPGVYDTGIKVSNHKHSFTNFNKCNFSRNG